MNVNIELEDCGQVGQKRSRSNSLHIVSIIYPGRSVKFLYTGVYELDRSTVYDIYIEYRYQFKDTEEPLKVVVEYDSVVNYLRYKRVITIDDGDNIIINMYA